MARTEKSKIHNHPVEIEIVAKPHPTFNLQAFVQGSISAFPTIYNFCTQELDPDQIKWTT